MMNLLSHIMVIIINESLAPSSFLWSDEVQIECLSLVDFLSFSIAKKTNSKSKHPVDIRAFQMGLAFRKHS